LGGNSFRLAVVGTKTYSELIPRDGFAIADNTATAQGVGGSITLHGIYDGNGNYTAFGGIEGQKENGTSGNYAGALVLKSRTNSGNLNEAIRIDSSQRVGIGTTSPGAKLHLANTGGNADLVLQGSASGESIINFGDTADLDVGQILYNHTSNYMRFLINTGEKMRIDSSGRVGIGTGSPSDLLHIAGTGTNLTGLRIVNTQHQNVASTAGLKFGITNSAGQRNCRIQAREQAADTNNIALDFFTSNADAADGETVKMTIDSTGNVGIGTTSPSRSLHVSGTGQQSILIGSTNAGGAALFLDGDANGDASGSDYALIRHSTAGDLEIVNYKTGIFRFVGTGSSEKARIDSSGRLLVGTTTEGAINADNLTVADSGNAGITIRSGSTSYGSLYFSKGTASTSEYNGFVEYNHNLDYINFGAGGNGKLRITSTGAFGIGGANYGTSGQVLTSQGSGSAPQWATPAGGKILQVKQTVKTDTFTTSASGNIAITGLSVSITPSATSSKILVMYSVNYDNNRSNSGGGFRIYRNASTLLANADSAGNRYLVNADFGANANQDQAGMHRSFTYLDSPSATSSLTYQLYIHKFDSSYTAYINRSQTDANEGDDPRMVSSITVMEVSS
jgi:hypothetical protein